MKIERYSVLLCILITSIISKAQNNEPDNLKWSSLQGFEYEIYAAVNIGGSAPIPVPAEIRHIDGYNPNLNLQIGTTVTKWFTPSRRWGVAIGLRFEEKGMKTRATVKNYGMEIVMDGSSVSGNWTGKVRTVYHSKQIAFPVTANVRINKRWKVNFGPYVALALNNDFNGEVHDGYLREGGPTGNKVTFEGDAYATYDFSNDIRLFQWGLQAGGSWLALNHLVINANLTWGLNDIFNSSFNTVTFNLYPIYLNFGFGYVF